MLLTYRPYAECQWNFTTIAQARKHDISRHLWKGITRFWKLFLSQLALLKLRSFGDFLTTFTIKKCIRVSPVCWIQLK